MMELHEDVETAFGAIDGSAAWHQASEQNTPLSHFQEPIRAATINRLDRMLCKSYSQVIYETSCL